MSNQDVNNQFNWDSLRECIDGVDTCSKYQKVITDDVLTLSKLEFGQVKLHLEPIIPAQIIQTVLQMFSSEMIKKKLQFKADVQDENTIVLGDPTRISQVLINLVSNAIKFTAHGSIIISLRIVDLGEKIEAIFSIQDTGCGMEETEMTQLFNRFEQITQRTYSDYEGSGLGLFISKHLAEIMGGTISVISEKSKGSRFTFNMISEKPTDLQIIEKKIVEEQIVTPESFSYYNVLVCEDNRINQRILVQLVQKAGCTSIAASDGVEAVEKYTNNSSINLVLMDVSMPRMDGFEATKKIREYEAQTGKENVIIIGISGNARKEYYDKGLEAGMNDYLYKVC
jgi:CheY-like chemotaxis protein